MPIEVGPAITVLAGQPHWQEQTKPINTRAICLNQSGSPQLLSQTISGGCSQIRFKHQQKFTGSGGIITLYVNDTERGTASVTTDVQTATFTVSNVSGDFVIKLMSNGVSRIAIDDLEWQTATSTNQAPTVTNISRNPSNPTSTDNVTVSASVVDPEGQLGSVVLYWGSTESSLTNQLTMSGNAGVYTASIPAQTTGTAVYYKITATDAANNSSSSSTISYTVSPASGIGDNTNSKLVRVYPNPFDNYINIETGNADNTSISIMSVIGTVVSQINFSANNYHLTTNNLKPGIYIIKITNKGKATVFRIVKQ